MLASLGVINPTTGLPVAVSTPTAGYPVSSGGWYFDSTDDWIKYGQLPEYQTSPSVAPVAAQQIALANAQAAGLQPTTTTVVQGGGSGVMQAPTAALNPGVSINSQTGELSVNNTVVATGPAVAPTAPSTVQVTTPAVQPIVNTTVASNPTAPSIVNLPSVQLPSFQLPDLSISSGGIQLSSTEVYLGLAAVVLLGFFMFSGRR